MITGAWGKAIELADDLPPNISWAFHVTNEDSGESRGNAVFNIFTAKPGWPSLRIFLGYGEPDEQDANSQSWFFDCLTVSIIQPKENRDDPDTNGPDGPTHDRPGDCAFVSRHEFVRIFTGQ
jgi:hypothetical protein